jgi:hypothetical protein
MSVHEQGIRLAFQSSTACDRQIHTDDAVPPCGLFFRCRLEAVEPIRDPHVGKARPRERRNQLCFQQSTGDSTGPEVDILARVLRQLDAEHDV